MFADLILAAKIIPFLGRRLAQFWLSLSYRLPKVLFKILGYSGFNHSCHCQLFELFEFSVLYQGNASISKK
jgi:hypothetical protein